MIICIELLVIRDVNIEILHSKSVALPSYLSIIFNVTWHECKRRMAAVSAFIVNVSSYGLTTTLPDLSRCIGPVRIRQRSNEIPTQPCRCLSLDGAGWQAKMASIIEFGIP